MSNLPDPLCGDPSRPVSWLCQLAPMSSLAPCIEAIVLYNVISSVYSAPLNQGKADCVSSTLEGNFKKLTSREQIYIKKHLESWWGTFLISPFGSGM